MLGLFRRRRKEPANATGPAGPTVSEEKFNTLNDRYRELRARYDAAQTNDDNRRHWALADGMSSAHANSAHVRRILRNRSRYEYDNGAYANGIIRTRADDLVGVGPTLQILSDDSALKELVEDFFSSWARAARFAEKLHTMDQTRCRDGEAFALFVTNPRLEHPIKLDLKLLEAEQVADPTGIDFPLPGKVDGVEYDSLGEATFYTVLSIHPGDALVRFPIPSERVNARYVLHWFRRDRPGQIRGVPELASALPLFPYLRRWTLATLAAAEYAASQAGVLETEGPFDPTTTTSSPFTPVEFDRGMFTELPAGVKLHQLQAEHPNQNYGDFKREVNNEQGRPVRMPSNVVSADSSKHNFSSAKLDHYGYRGALGVDRRFCAVSHLDRVYAELVREGQAAGELPRKVDVLGLRRLWIWPGWPSMDSDQADQDNVRLANGTLTRQLYWLNQGLDPAEMEEQWLKEKAIYAPTPPPAPTPATPPAPAQQGNPDAPKTQTADAAHRLNGHYSGRGG